MALKIRMLLESHFVSSLPQIMMKIYFIKALL